jgi:hypothetical protein
MSPDITMCLSKDCPRRKQCYRHEATPDPGYQSYFIRETPCELATGLFIDMAQMDKKKSNAPIWGRRIKCQRGSHQTCTSGTLIS